MDNPSPSRMSSAFIVKPRRPNLGTSKLSWISDQACLLAASLLVEEGFLPANIYLLELGTRARQFEYPRNLVWKDLPVVSRPVYSYGYPHVSTFEKSESDLKLVRLTKEPMQSGNSTIWVSEKDAHRVWRKKILDMAETSERVVVLEGALDESLWAGVSPFFSRKSPGLPSVSVISRDATSFDDVAESRLIALEERYRGHDHLLYNHIVNMMIIGSRAFFAAAKDVGSSHGPGWNYRLFHESQINEVGGHDTVMFEPMFLQALFAIAREQPPGEPIVDTASFHRSAAQLPFVAVGDDQHVEFNWAGSGKYLPLIVDMGTLPSRTGTEPYTGLTNWPHDLAVTLSAVFNSHLAGFVGSGSGLTKQGASFLKRVGDKAKDPDVILRWRSGNLMATDKDIPEIDRWLVRFFRTMKRHVAHLPSSPFHEEGANWRNPPTRVCIVRGLNVDLRRSTFEQIDELKTMSGSRGSLDHGVDFGFTYPEGLAGQRPSHFWVGKRLRVTDRIYDWKPDFNGNCVTEAIDAEVRDGISEFYPSLKKMLSRLPTTFFAVEAEDAPIGDICDVPTRLPRLTSEGHGSLYFGRLYVDPVVEEWQSNGTLEKMGYSRVLDNPSVRHHLDVDHPVRLVFREKVPGIVVGTRIGIADIETGHLVQDIGVQANFPWWETRKCPEVAAVFDDLEDQFWFLQPGHRVTPVRVDWYDARITSA